MTLSIEDATRFAQVFKGLVDGVSVAVLDKRQAVRLALTTMFAGGHLLLEDAPGTGKTALARAISAVIDGTHSRIQFTPDLLPSDITGVNMFNQKTGEWVFHAGPIATQNPVEQAGTYPLPEAQLDRFLMKTSIGYPSRSAMIDVLDGSASPDRSKNLKPLLSGKDIVAWAALASANHTDRAVLDYVAALAEATREDESSLLGVSTRGAIGMVRCARVWAAAQGRNFVLPDDIKALAVPVWAHRVIVDPDAAFSGATAEGVIQRALTSVPAPAVGA